MAILGALLTAVSVSHGRMTRQDRQSRDRLVAVGLLSAWADRHWAERARWAAWAEGGGSDGPPPLLDRAEAAASTGEPLPSASWGLVVGPGPRLEPEVPGVTSLRLAVVDADSDRDAAPLALLDVLVPELEEPAEPGALPRLDRSTELTP